MLRTEKAALVEQMRKGFESVPHAVVARFRGLSVNQASALRSRVRAAGGTYRVVQNRLARRAAQGTPMEKLAESLDGPCAVAAHEQDAVALAKTLSEFAKENPELELLAGVVDAGEWLDAEGIKKLASIPSREVLRAQLLGLIAAPATRLARLLGTPGGHLARAVDARRERLAADGAEG